MDEKIEKATEKLVKIYEKIENDLLIKIASHFSVNDEFLNSDYWRIKKLEEMGLFNQEIIEYLKKATGKTENEILNALKQIEIETVNINKLNRLFEDEMLKINPEILSNNYTIKSIIDTAYNELNDKLIQMSNKIEKSTGEAYLDVVESAYLKTSMGTHSYQEAIREAINDLSNKGIKVLTYKTVDENGNVIGIREYDIEGAVRREVLTASRQLNNSVAMEVANELECEYLYLSEHLQCRLSHFDWQGTIIKKEKLSSVTGYGEIDGLAGINCRHYFEPYFGDARGNDLKRFNKSECMKAYKDSQKQRYLERGIRKWKRKAEMFKASDDFEAYSKCKSKVKQWQKRSNNFADDNNLKRDFTREYVNENPKNLLPYKDVTQEWLDKAESRKGKVINRNFYIDKKGNKYEVDGKNVIFEPSNDEIETANFIHQTFGGNIYLNPKVNTPENVESSDYLWKNQLWDKKIIGKDAISLKRAVDNAIKQHKNQTDYILLDITNSKIEQSILIEQTKKIFSTKGREWVKGIMIINNNKVIRIYIQNKRG